MRQLGYPLEIEPRIESLKDFILPDLGAQGPDLLLKIKRAWTLIHRKRKELGKRDCRVKEPYCQWVIERVKEVKLSYSAKVPVPSPEPKPIHASKEEVDALITTIAQLTKENEKLQSKLHAMDKDNTKLKRKSEDDVELLAKSMKKAKIKEYLNEKYRDGLSQADLELYSLCKQLKQTKKEHGEARHWFKLDIKEKKILRNENDVEIKELKFCLHNVKAKVDHECRLNEEVVQTSYVTP